MALGRRSGRRFSGSIWPGFVDAMTALLLVLIFVLSIFMIVQFMLRETITGQKTELGELSTENSRLSDALDQAKSRNDTLQKRLSGRAQELARARRRIDEVESRAARLAESRETARQGRAIFAAQLGAVQATNTDLRATLAAKRKEVDAQAEAARLAAAQREALQAMTEELRQKVASAKGRVGRLSETLDETKTALSEKEAARLAEAAAAQRLRERLQTSQAELSAMSLNLEAKRQKAEKTLTMLAAAREARDELDTRLAAALARQDRLAAARDQARSEQTDLAGALERTKAERADLAKQLAIAESARMRLQEALSKSKDSAAETAKRLSDAADKRRALASRLESSERETAATQSQLLAAIAARDRLAGKLDQARTEREAQATERNRAAAEADDLRATLQETRAALASARAELDTLEKRAAKRSDTAEKLADALAAKRRVADRLSEAERQAALLKTAKSKLSEAQEQSAEEQRRIAALNAQVASLRSQLGSLRATLQAAKQSQSEEETVKGYRSEFFTKLRDVLADREGVRVKGDRFVFASEVLFNTGSAQLLSSGRQKIRDVAQTMLAAAEDIPDGVDWILRVDGHTDRTPVSGRGPYASNWELSQARALSVVRFMIDKLGFPPDRLAATGFGEYQPVTDADTPQARAKNRRIEFKLTER